MTMQTSEVLNLTADAIEQRGWRQGPSGPGESLMAPWGGGATGNAPLCLEGGIAAALGLSLGYDEHGNLPALQKCAAYAAVQRYLDAEGLGPVWRWNDRRGRTASEVIEVLRATALIEAAREREAAEVSA